MKQSTAHPKKPSGVKKRFERSKSGGHLFILFKLADLISIILMLSESDEKV